MCDVTHGRRADIRRLVSCDVQSVSQAVMLPVLSENDQKVVFPAVSNKSSVVKRSSEVQHRSCIQ